MAPHMALDGGEVAHDKVVHSFNSPNGHKPVSRLHIERRENKSLSMRSLQHVLKPMRPHVVKPRSALPGGSQRLTPADKVEKKDLVTERQVDGVWLYDVKSAKDTADEIRPHRRIFYFAGGGWQMTATGGHWKLAHQICDEIPGTVVTMVSYALAPKSPASESLPQLRKLYHTLMTDPEIANDRVIFAGDSAGGNVILGLVLWALSEQTDGPDAPRTPDAVVGICPSTDLRHLDPMIAKTAGDDPMFTPEFIQSTASAWADGQTTDPATDDKDGKGYKEWSMSDPRVSPTLADLSLFVKYGVQVHGITGTSDVLAPEAMAFRDRCAELGVEGRWLEWEGQMHCFPLTFPYGLKEGREAVAWLIDILKTI